MNVAHMPGFTARECLQNKKSPQIQVSGISHAFQAVEAALIRGSHPATCALELPIFSSRPTRLTAFVPPWKVVFVRPEMMGEF
jgi:hypothetical protein